MNVRQHELFTREQAPRTARLLRGRACAPAGGRAAAKPLRWESMAAWCRHIGRLLAVETCSSAHFARFHATARRLTADRIRECRHADDLARAERLILDVEPGMRDDWMHGLDRVWTRAERGALLVELRNRQVQLALGREAPRERGPRLDPRRLPDDRLDALIQRHRDLAVVEACRAERQRRQAIP